MKTAKTSSPLMTLSKIAKKMFATTYMKPLSQKPPMQSCQKRPKETHSVSNGVGSFFLMTSSKYWFRTRSFLNEKRNPIEVSIRKELKSVSRYRDTNKLIANTGKIAKSRRRPQWGEISPVYAVWRETAGCKSCRQLVTGGDWLRAVATAIMWSPCRRGQRGRTGSHTYSRLAHVPSCTRSFFCRHVTAPGHSHK